MKRTTPAVDKIAPTPGTLVCLTARKLCAAESELAPVVFSAIDVNTHLQVGQLYLTLTFASAVDFLDFARENFPFPLRSVLAPMEAPFHNASDNHKFAQILAERGIECTMAIAQSHQELFEAMSKLTFNRVLVGAVDLPSEREVVKELLNFLFFHNNYRSLPSLSGMTPLQKLKTFPEYQYLHRYDLLAASGAPSR